jgi:phosphoglycolate phosphatase
MDPGAKAVVFDLDGTLVDSAVSIAAALERLRAARAIRSPFTVGDVRRLVSQGVEALVEAALAGPRPDLAGDVAEFRAEYAATRTAADCLYDGMQETLEILASSGLGLAVCSNKPQHLCVKVLEDTGILRYFSAIKGGDAVDKPKPHPAHLLAAIDALGVDPLRGVYVGDSSVDLLAAQAAGVPFVLAKYGYADPPLLRMNLASLAFVESPRDLPAIVLGEARRG